MVWVCYSSSPTCLAFVAALLKLLLFAVLCHLLLWGHNTTPGRFTPKGVVLTRGVVYSPKGVVVSPKRGDFTPLKSGHKTTQGGFKGRFIPNLGVVLCPGLPLCVQLSASPSCWRCRKDSTAFASRFCRLLLRAYSNVWRQAEAVHTGIVDIADMKHVFASGASQYVFKTCRLLRLSFHWLLANPERTEARR